MMKVWHLFTIITLAMRQKKSLGFQSTPANSHLLSSNLAQKSNLLKSNTELNVVSRRNVIGSLGRKAFVGAVSSFAFTSSAIAKDKKTQDVPVGESLVSAKELAEKLRAVPTFTLVDKAGAPFAVVGEDAKLSTYFFTTYDEAKRIVELASVSYKKTKAAGIKEANAKRAKQKLPPLNQKQIEDEFGKNPWQYARVSSIGLDLAVSLSIKASGKRTGAYFFVQSPEDDVQDALALSKDDKKELAEGKVPLFYMEDLKINKTESPVFFKKSQLIKEWQKQNPSKDLKDMPEILISELFSLIFEMVKPGGKDDELKTIVFVPPENSKDKAKECNNVGEGVVPFKLGERIIVL